MNRHSLLLLDPPTLSDEAAVETLEFLYQLTAAFENRYANQLRRFYEPLDPPDSDPIDEPVDFDDDLPF